MHKSFFAFLSLSGPEFEKQLEEHMENYHPEILEAIRTTGNLTTETDNQLRAALSELVSRFA